MKPHRLVFLILILAAPASAQVRPVTAKVRQTEQLIVGGVVVETHVREGVIGRTSDGLLLIQRFTNLDGKELTGPLAHGILVDRKDGFAYNLDYRTHTGVRTSGNSKVDPEHDPDAGRVFTNAQDQVEGISCRVIPESFEYKGVETPIGDECVSPEYGLALKRDVTMALPNAPGKSKHIVMQAYDIQLGVEPGAELTDISQFEMEDMPRTGVQQ